MPIGGYGLTKSGAGTLNGTFQANPSNTAITVQGNITLGGALTAYSRKGRSSLAVPVAWPFPEASL